MHRWVRTPISRSVIAVIAVLATVLGTLAFSAAASADTVDIGGLRYTIDGSSQSTPLDGVRVDGSSIYISWDRPAPDTQYSGVEFRLDGDVVSDDCCSLSASAPVVRGSSSNAKNTRSDGVQVSATEGHHEVVATATHRDGTRVTAAASFTVGTPTTAAPTTTTTAPTTTTTAAPTTTTTAPPATTTTTTTTAPPPTTGLVSVKDHGARGDGSTDDTTAVKAAFSAAASKGSGVLFPAGTYRLSKVIDIPDAVQLVELASGALVRQYDDDSAFQKVGDVEDPQYTVTDARRGQRVVTLNTTSGLSVGDWFYFGSDDMLHSTKGYRRGFLRQIEAVNGNQITVDQTLHSSLVTAPRGWEVDLTPPVEIRGGVIEQHDPKTKYHSLVHFELVKDPRVIGTELRNCGASGVKTIGTIGGLIDSHIHDCLDDQSGTRYNSGRHHGYGVEAAGPTRDLVVRGTSTRTRHGFTTNGAYGPHSDKRLLLIGEPEDVVVSMHVWETTSSGLDTHEPGWNIVFRDCRSDDAGVYWREGSRNGKEGGFGMFIRARATRVENCVFERSAQDGLGVATAGPGMTTWAAGDGPRIVDTRILDTEGTRGTHFFQPAHVERLTITGHHLVGMQFHANATGSTGSNVSIDLEDYSGSYGIIGSGYVTMSALSIINATRLLGS